MSIKYEQLKCIHQLAVETGDVNELRKIPSLLNDWRIKCREVDGELLWTNLSVPTSAGETVTIGLRYRKKDTTLTEDIFELNAKAPDKVKKVYKGCYQKSRPEYEGTHKQQDVEPRSFTSINTCCLYFGERTSS